MPVKRELYPLRWLAAFALSTAVFIGIFLFALSVSYLNYEHISEDNHRVSLYLQEINASLAHFRCDSSLFVSASEKLDYVGRQIAILEEKLGKQDRRVIEQKKLYSELEYQHYLLTREFNQKCGTHYVPLFFFYSNVDEDGSERVGFIVSSFKRAYPDVMTYSFDFNLDDSRIVLLRETYRVTASPAVFCAGHIVRVRSIDDLSVCLGTTESP